MFVPDPLLAVRALFPAVLHTLVAADMDIFGREKIDHLAEYILEETERAVFSGAKRVFLNAVKRRHLIIFTHTTQIRICGECGSGMPRHFDFGDNGNKTVGGILHDIADLVLRIEAAVRIFVEFTHSVEYVREQIFLPYRTDRSQFGIFFDLNAPTLIIGQMPVETVDLVQCQ